ncbi:DUF4062 domain-containing protein [Exiguobacterium sp. s150]|uniref:DUF4062 domain-containing protein n=1 Tax=Exiguobacterium sp. s150 TaxID=2751221 RepID=UPI001BED08E5|nr:DUF4062 domain-containing protein [Exiguobacterium sp. s150]
MNKKIQVFISSTFLDLQNERQAAVEATLDANHIPAGMELFKAGNDDQWTTIKRWIDESDVYMLILGGRYGSIEPISGKSYTQLEYEYALETKTPIFSVVLKNSWLYQKAAEQSETNVFEQRSKEKYDTFKEMIHKKMVREVENIAEIKLAVHTSLNDLIYRSEYEFSGWVKGSEILDQTELINENRKLLKENTKLKDMLEKQRKHKTVGNLSYEEVKKVMEQKRMAIPEEAKGLGKGEMTLLELFLVFRSHFTRGVPIQTSKRDSNVTFILDIASQLINLSVCEVVKRTGAKIDEIRVSKEGNKFLAYWDVENIII